MTREIKATQIRVGDEIEFWTDDGMRHRFVVGELPRREVLVLPVDVPRTGEHLFELRARDVVRLLNRPQEAEPRPHSGASP